MKRFLLWPFIYLLLYHFDVMAMERGEGLFKTCSPCHGNQGAGDQLQMAPAIAGMSEWYLTNQLHRFRSGARGRHYQDLGGLRMRPMARTIDNETDLKLIAKYVSSLPKASFGETFHGQPLKGKAGFAICAGCHGVDGKGMQPVGGPDLTVPQDWYLLTQLKNFKAKIRGSDPVNDPFGSTMSSMAATIADEQAMKDIITYIQSLR